MSNRPLRIGITGGIGSGKTLVTKIFSLLGIPVYDADSHAKSITESNQEVRRRIKQLLGEEAYVGEKYNKAYVSSVVLKDDQKLMALNEIIHPALALAFEEWTNQHALSPYIIKEAAILFETGSYKKLDKVFLVSAPLELRMDRVLKRDKFRSKEELLALIKKQMPEEEKAKLASGIILNDESQLLIPQVLDIHQSILASK